MRNRRASTSVDETGRRQRRFKVIAFGEESRFSSEFELLPILHAAFSRILTRRRLKSANGTTLVDQYIGIKRAVLQSHCSRDVNIIRRHSEST